MGCLALFKAVILMIYPAPMPSVPVFLKKTCLYTAYEDTVSAVLLEQFDYL